MSDAEFDIAQAEARTGDARSQRDMALKLYEEQIKTSTELGCRVAKAEEALKVAEFALNEVLDCEECGACSVVAKNAITKINSIIGGK